jgi:hypothetical protein
LQLMQCGVVWCAEWEVEGILDKKTVKGADLYLVKWKNFPEKFNSWEPIDHLEGSQPLIAEFEKLRAADSVATPTPVFATGSAASSGQRLPRACPSPCPCACFTHPPPISPLLVFTSLMCVLLCSICRGEDKEEAWPKGQKSTCRSRSHNRRVCSQRCGRRALCFG